MKYKSNNRISHQVRISEREAFIIMIALRLFAISHPDLYDDAMHYHRVFDRVHKKILAKIHSYDI